MAEPDELTTERVCRAPGGPPGTSWAAAWLGLAVAVILACVAIALFHDVAPGAHGQAGGVAGRVPVFAGIPPVAWLLERVGGSHVQIGTLLQPGADPHVFEPTPRQGMALGRARLFFTAGMPFENELVERIASRHAGLTVVDTPAGIVKQTTTDPDEPAGADPHVWLSPPLLRVMAGNVAEALALADPAHAADYRHNAAAVSAELAGLDARIARRLAPFRGRRFYVFHPAFAYFAAAYGLVQEAVEVEGKSPTPRQLQALVRQARADGVSVIFLQPQFDPHAAEAVARAIGGTVMPMDDLARDLPRNLDDMAEKIATGFEGIGD